MFTTILCCLVKANATLASRTDSLDHFCSCTVNNSASLIPMKPLYTERMLVGLTFNMSDHTGWWWLGKTIGSWTNEQQASAKQLSQDSNIQKKKNDIKNEKKDRKSRIMARKDNMLSPRLPQSGPDTSVDLLPLLLGPAHVFFLDMFFSWTHFLEIHISSTWCPQEKWNSDPRGLIEETRG